MAALRNRIGIFQITNWDNFGHKLSSFRGFIYATRRAALITCKTVKQKSYIQIECSFSVAERKGFEPLRALWALHDFQSCALDQLSHLSIYSAVSPHLTTCYIIASTSGIVKQYFEKNQFFSNKLKKRKKEHMEEVFCKNDLKSKGGYKHMPFLPQP